MGSYLHPNMVKNANFRGLRRIWVFAHIVRRYNSAAESTSLLSSVVSLAIKYVSITILTLKQQACIIHSNSCFFCRYEKGLLNFVSERVKLVYGSIKNTRLAFQTSKTKSNRPQTSELKSVSKFELLFYWKNFEKYMIFYTIPWSRWNRTHKLRNTRVVPFAIAELGQMSWSSTHTKIWTRQQLYHCIQRLNHEYISMLCFLTPLAVIKCH